jgi:CRISPR-associated protein Cas2
MERTFYVLAYDIANNKRRNKIAKLCEAWADRVQESVFEAYLAPAELEKLLKKADRLMKPEEDSLRIYMLCSACKGKIAMRGQGQVTPAPGVKIV